MEPQEEDPFLAGWASWMDQALQAEPADVELSPELQAQEARLEALRAAPVPAIIIAARDGDVDALRQELDFACPSSTLFSRRAPMQMRGENNGTGHR